MKKLLYINIGFYNYEDKIIDAIKRLGYDVYTFYDKPLINIKSLIFKRFLKSSDVNFFENIDYQLAFLENLPNGLKFDIIFVIVGRCLSLTFLDKLRNEHCSGKMILYLWDDVKRVENFNKCRSFYDVIYSFDRIDCKENGFIFLPLFYINDFKYQGEKKIYDLCSIGAGHSGRYEVIDSILEQVKNYKFNNFIYLYMGTYTNIIRMIKHHSLTIPEYIHKSFLPFNSTVEVMKQSKYVIDVQYLGQNGLTIRTFEALGSKAKIITTNKEIRNYDFYNSQNVFVVDRNNPIIDVAFFEEPYKDIPEEIVSKYSIDSWISTILNDYSK